MAHFEWNSSIELGIEKFDRDHMQLLGTVNLLASALEDADPGRLVGLILMRLNDYTIYHLDAEEAYLKEIGYDKYEEHIQEHQAFRKMLTGHVEAYRSGRHVEADLFKFLGDWLVNHIGKVDRKYAEYVRAHALPMPEA